MRVGRILIALLIALPAFAQQAPKPCEELKSEIAQKLEAKQVKSYTLEIVPKDQKTDAAVVGTCEQGSKKIVYRRGAKPAEATKGQQAQGR